MKHFRGGSGSAIVIDGLGTWVGAGWSWLELVGAGWLVGWLVGAGWLVNRGDTPGRVAMRRMDGGAFLCLG